jgi:error-prone DNA polymerase
VPLFQEQLLRMAMTVAGFSGGAAEELRRAVTHKRSGERMRGILDALRTGMRARGIPQRAQDQIAQQISSFALYGFPESHAASFALLAYASAYIRAHHPACFLAAMLNQYPLGFYAPATLIQDARRHGVRVLPLDVQHSGWLCRLEAGAVRLGLRYARGLRESAGRRIEGAAPFASLADLARRAALARPELERLAELGACASLGLRRRAALWQVAALEPHLLAPASPGPATHAHTYPHTHSHAHEHSPLREMTPWEETAADYHGSGLTAGPHLVAQLRPELARRGITPAAELAALPGGRWVRSAGAVIVRQRPGTAKGIFFLTLEDETGTAQAIVRPALFREHRALLQSAPLLLVEGPLQNQDGVIHILARRFARLETPDPGALPASHDFH